MRVLPKSASDAAIVFLLGTLLLMIGRLIRRNGQMANSDASKQLQRFQVCAFWWQAYSDTKLLYGDTQQVSTHL